MPSYRIVCIIKPDPDSSHKDITKIGYYETAYKPKVIIPVCEAIKRIEANPQEFYVRVPDKTVFVTVEKPPQAKPFIKTTPDSKHQDQLLSLEQLVA